MSMTKPTKLSIIALESMVGAKASALEAQYNPKEMAVDKSVPWSKHKDSKSDHPHLEFSGADGRSMSFELMFDTYEDDANVQGKVEILQRMAMVRNPAESAPEDEKRPSRIKVIWSGGLPPFEGVLESVGTKYTMFSPKGFPVRATCTVKVKEASRASFKKGT
jgi:hypothetical protein